MSLPLVAVVGRPNVGKSTLINRITQTEDAIVHEMRGVTRDRSYHRADWNGVDFMIIDTGGIALGDTDMFQGSITSQALVACEESDCIIFVVDGRTGVTSEDTDIARVLLKSDVPSCSPSTSSTTPTARTRCSGSSIRSVWANPCRFRPRMAMARATCSMPSCASFPKMQVMTRRATR